MISICPVWLTCKNWFLTASWAISVYYAFQRTWKPFNPILGETYEMANYNGVNFISEQVRDISFGTKIIVNVLLLPATPRLLIQMVFFAGQPSPTNECWSCWKWAFYVWLYFKTENKISGKFHWRLPSRKVILQNHNTGCNYIYWNQNLHMYIILNLKSWIYGAGHGWHLKEMELFLTWYLLWPKFTT